MENNLNIEQKWAMGKAMEWILQGRQFTKEQEEQYKAEMEWLSFDEKWTPSDSYERNLFDTLGEMNLPEDAWKSIHAAIEREGRKL